MKDINRIIKALLALLILAVLPGCTRRVYVASNAYADSELLPYGFPLSSSFTVNALKTKPHNAMLSKEIKNKIRTLLQTHEYTLAPEPEKAEYELAFSYATKSSIETRHVTAYVPGTTQVTQAVVQGYNGAKGGAVYHEETSTPGTFVSVPEEYTLYHHSITVHVYGANKFTHTKVREELWQATMTTSNEISDIRAVIDCLLGSVFKHFGHSTGQHIIEQHKRT